MICFQRILHPVTWLLLSTGYMKACDFELVRGLFFFFLSIKSYDDLSHLV